MLSARLDSTLTSPPIGTVIHHVRTVARFALHTVKAFAIVVVVTPIRRRPAYDIDYPLLLRVITAALSAVNTVYTSEDASIRLSWRYHQWLARQWITLIARLVVCYVAGYYGDSQLPWRAPLSLVIVITRCYIGGGREQW